MNCGRPAGRDARASSKPNTARQTALRDGSRHSNRRGILKEAAAAAKKKPSKAVAIISYDEKPGIQAIATTAPDLPPEPGAHATFAREFEYKRTAR
jgi:hypothetical protein